jgi:DNA-directed RNA polymerase subunit alpha
MHDDRMQREGAFGRVMRAYVADRGPMRCKLQRSRPSGAVPPRAFRGHADCIRTGIMDWSTLIRPRKLNRERDVMYGDFVCEPLDRGVGDELGRALRHALLHDVPGTAVVAVRAQHASATWMRMLCLNASQIVIRGVDGARHVRMDAPAGSVVRAGDLGIEVVDPRQELCIAEKDLAIELWLERGCGMRFGSTLRERALPDRAWAVDAFFAPVRCVDVFTERPRIGPWQHLDRLLIHIETNGAISADEALWMATRSGVG